MNPDEPTTMPVSPGRSFADARIGTTVGRYRVLGVLGEGGFGVVYEGEQSEPVSRRVALKVLKPGMDSASIVARFEAERQALAVMDHPGIAKVLDGGTTEEGYPYFVMELVRGEPITSFCDRQRMTINERLTLFRKVCAAVQHAHTKAVIHRDLKPNNILVTLQDGTPTPKVIDFGVAKALNQRLTERTLFTERGQMIGTPEYMSPEQAEMSTLDIDTRTDVYSLGVVLYELLTGALPFEPKRLREGGLAEILRIIREEEPPRPSTRLTPIADAPDSDECTTKLLEARRTDLTSIRRGLRGNLDAVVLRAMAKLRDDRYLSPDDLSEDIGRVLDGQPTEALLERVRTAPLRFILRHREEIDWAILLICAPLLPVGMSYEVFLFGGELPDSRAMMILGAVLSNAITLGMIFPVYDLFARRISGVDLSARAMAILLAVIVAVAAIPEIVGVLVWQDPDAFTGRPAVYLPWFFGSVLAQIVVVWRAGGVRLRRAVWHVSIAWLILTVLYFAMIGYGMLFMRSIGA